jgi:hypothetical protein
MERQESPVVNDEMIETLFAHLPTQCLLSDRPWALIRPPGGPHPVITKENQRAGLVRLPAASVGKKRSTTGRLNQTGMLRESADLFARTITPQSGKVDRIKWR